MGIIKYNSHSGYIASVINEEILKSIISQSCGIYRRLKNPGNGVERGGILAEILDPYEGEVVFQVISPTDGIIFFALTSPLVMGNMVAYKIIRRIHEWL